MTHRWGLVAACFLAFSSPSRSQPNDRQAFPLQGTQGFRNILEEFKLRPVTSAKDLPLLKPAETLIVIFGGNGTLESVRSRLKLREFLKEGGALLIATDRKTPLPEWGHQVNGGKVLDKANAYRGVSACPLVHAPFLGIERGLAANHPSFLEPTAGAPALPDGLEVLAEFSESAHVLRSPEGPAKRMTPREKFERGVRGAEKKLPERLPYMIGSKGADRLLVLAGHGVFMNMMLAQGDNGNVTFARSCVRWLCVTRTGEVRKDALFLENGNVAREFDFGLSGPARLPLPPTQVLNRLVRGLEDENFFNKLLLRSFTRDGLLRTGLLLLSVILASYCAWRLWRARQRTEAAVPLLTGPAVAGADLAVLVQRRDALIQRSDFREPAQGLARSFFEQFVPTAVPPRFDGHHAKLPLVAVQATWWRRGALHKHVRYLWQLAYGRPGPVSANKLARLPAILDLVAAALRQGRLVVKDKG